MADADLDETRAALLEVVRRFVRDEVVPAAGRYDAEDTYPEPLIETMKELGLFGITVPVEHGGLGLDLVTYAMVVEELAWGWMSLTGALNTHFMGCYLLKEFGTPAQRATWLPCLATGEVRGAYSLSEPDAGSDVAAIRTRARREAVLAVTLVKTADTDPPHRGMSVLLIAKEPGATRHGGITVGPNVHKLGYRGIETVEVAYDDHRVPADAVLGGEEGHGFAQMMAAVELGRVNIAARAVGVARRAFDESLAYAQERETFGRPIAQHQAIAFTLAEMGTKLTAARLLYREAAERKGRGERADLQASMAKLFCSETCWEICQDALRIHGGNGYAADYPIERLYRDAPLMIVGEGTNEIQKLVIARRLLEGDVP